MNTTTSLKPNPFAPQRKPQKSTNPQNFLEALKSIGGSVVDQTKQLVGDVATDAMDSFTGYNPTSESSEAFRHPEIFTPPIERRPNLDQATRLFDSRQIEIKQQIDAIRQELKLLAQELGSLGSSIQKAVDEEITQPGSYHISFFQALRRFIVSLRKRVAESRNWLAISQQRKAARSVFWGSVKKSGTKFMLSSERTLQTQTG